MTLSEHREWIDKVAENHRHWIYKVVENHRHWILQDCEGWENMRADLSGAYLSCADLSRTDLRYAQLSGADCRFARLNGADLNSVDLTNTNLTGAYLIGAYLRYARLSGADFQYADLSNAKLNGADLRNADFSNATLRDVDFTNADFRGANFTNADLRGAKNLELPMSCPSHGEFTAWKKVGNKIVKLVIPEDAKRQSSTGRKCRCDKAFVVAIENIDGIDSGLTEITNENYTPLAYKIGEMVYPDSFDENRWNECSHGIHFFVDRDEAVRY